jgi:soluble lytic murein transglycosylase-like protein
VFDVLVPESSVDLRAARARRRSRARHVRLVRRARTRRRAVRFALATLVVSGAALAQAAGPQSAEALLPLVVQGPAAHCPVPATLRGAFVDASRATGVRLGLLTAVARVESGFDQSARSRAGAVGVLQVMPATAAELRYDPEDVRANVMAGAVYLRRMLDRYGSVELALAAYNAGPTAVDRRGGPPTAETAAYVERVDANRRALGECR